MYSCSCSKSINSTISYYFFHLFYLLNTKDNDGKKAKPAVYLRRVRFARFGREREVLILIMIVDSINNY